MALSICAFNSIELNDQELMEDGLNLFVDWDLSDFFSDLLISRDLAMNNEDGEFDQIASILKVDRNLQLDLVRIKECIEFVKPLDADTVYFKFKT